MFGNVLGARFRNFAYGAAMRAGWLTYGRQTVQNARGVDELVAEMSCGSMQSAGVEETDRLGNTSESGQRHWRVVCELSTLYFGQGVSTLELQFRGRATAASCALLWGCVGGSETV